MTFANNISVVALIVSLVALFIALLQLSQAFLGTADGYRRCAESVLGPWHRLRHRKWHFSEFRFETQYITPQILILSGREFDEARSNNHEIYNLTSAEMLDDPDCPELRETVHKRKKTPHADQNSQDVSSTEPKQQNDNREPTTKLAQSTVNVQSSSTFRGLWTIRNRKYSDKHDPEKATSTDGIKPLARSETTRTTRIHDIGYDSDDDTGTKSVVARTLSNVLPGSLKRRRRRAAKKELRVTWLQLLQDLHSLYFSYLPGNCSDCVAASVRPGWTEADLDHLAAACPLPVNDKSVQGDKKAEQTDTFSELQRTRAAVIYRQWTWDFMPPDMVRPLAETTVGDIIIIARRLRMAWRELDLKNNKLQADGNGYSLTSTNIHGLGIVMRFNSTGNHNRFPRLISNQAVDKLICGKLPGCPVLVNRDFDLVHPNRTVARPNLPFGILSQIGMRERDRLEVAKANYEETDCELMMLLCPFLPLEHSAIVCYSNPAYRPNGAVRKSVFHFWEGRWALMKCLGERLDRPSSKHKELVDVHDTLRHLSTTWSHDFYCRYDRATITNSAHLASKTDHDRAISKEQLIAFCRQTFNQTTEYLKGPGREMHRKSGGQTKYLHLVAAHIKMARAAIKQALDFVDHRQKPPERTQDALKKKYGFTAVHGNFVFQQQVEIGFEYARHVLNLEYGVKRYLQDKGLVFEDGDDEVEAMWWKLMLRGIVWDMASWNEDGGGAGEPIPGILYGDRTPVWIT